MSPDSSSTLFENQDQVSDSAVSDFLKRLESLKQKTDSDEKDRAQKLEEEIEEAKRQRLARRLARSRSLSPEKFASSTSSAGIPPSRSTITVNNESITERKSTPRLSFDNSPVLSPTPAIAGRRSPVSAKESPLAQSISKFSGLDTSSPAQIRLNPAIQPTPVLRGVSPSPFLGRDTSSSRAPSNSPASNLSSPLAPKPTQSVSTMEKIKKWENSAEIDQSATIAGDEPTVVPMPKANDTESRSKKELESSEISVSRLEHIPDLSSSRESESSSSSIATELLMQAESKHNDIVAHPREQSVAVKQATSQECDNAISSLSRRTSGLNLTSTSTAASQSRFDSNIDKDKEAADREEERLSKFLRPSSQRPPQKDRLQLHSNYTPIFPSPSVVRIFRCFSLLY
ncbi:hypothetical protein POJ06DRAFT_95871 [Lipomyces tetrasporus]|uniref:DUF4045 domain-containing protein n=1 Tax=Lipomyces tetrasporus TaxID=54092 RepID=A0AAD7QTX7_9ASCO|nr:uncharacterized protein POJ06DRAFT_95871 [Lipomyces tetrasporus]KAJ8101390.1 hypothetical protein POJ06DRAFT_95871 [Lipomyces tetrasporus]